MAIPTPRMKLAHTSRFLGVFVAVSVLVSPIVAFAETGGSFLFSGWGTSGANGCYSEDPNNAGYYDTNVADPNNSAILSLGGIQDPSVGPYSLYLFVGGSGGSALYNSDGTILGGTWTVGAGSLPIGSITRFTAANCVNAPAGGGGMYTAAAAVADLNTAYAGTGTILAVAIAVILGGFAALLGLYFGVRRLMRYITGRGFNSSGVMMDHWKPGPDPDAY